MIGDAIAPGKVDQATRSGYLAAIEIGKNQTGRKAKWIMTKYISVYEPIGDGTKDRGEKQYCLVCSDEGIRKASGIGSHITVENYPLSHIVQVDCFRSGEPQSHMTEGAAAGLILGGIKGAVIGGMLTSGSSKPWWIEIELQNQVMRYFRFFRDGDHETFMKWAKQHGVKTAW